MGLIPHPLTLPSGNRPKSQPSPINIPSIGQTTARICEKDIEKSSILSTSSPLVEVVISLLVCCQVVGWSLSLITARSLPAPNPTSSASSEPPSQQKLFRNFAPLHRSP